MERISKLISKAILGALLLTIAILCFVVNSKSKGSGDAFQAISIVMGVVFIVLAALVIVAAGVMKKRIFTPESLGAASFLALGIFFVADKTVGGMILTYIVEYVPYELVVVGSVFVADAILLLVLQLTKKSGNNTLAVVAEVVTGGITLLLGILAFAVAGIRDNKFLILGIILLVYAIFNILEGVFFFFNTVDRTDDNVIDAEVIETNDTETKEE